MIHLKTLITELNVDTQISAIQQMLKKNQVKRAQRILKQLSGVSPHDNVLKAKFQKFSGQDVHLEAFFGLTDNDIIINFYYVSLPSNTNITKRFDYYRESDSIDSGTSADKIRLISRSDAVFVVNTIRRINSSTKIRVQDFIIQHYEQISEDVNSNPLDGMRKRQAINYIYKTFNIQNRLKGFFTDDYWKPINELIGDLQNGGVPIEIMDTEYYKDNNGNPAGKIWQCNIPFVNQNNRQDKLYVRITAAGAGSIKDPLDRYDVTFVVS